MTDISTLAALQYRNVIFQLPMALFILSTGYVMTLRNSLLGSIPLNCSRFCRKMSQEECGTGGM